MAVRALLGARVIGGTILCLSLLYAGHSASQSGQSTSGAESNLLKAELALNGYTLSVEVADTDAAREKGLSGRDELAPNSGMLFIFDAPEQQYFWMRNTRFDLDLALFDHQAMLIEVANLYAHDERVYWSRLPAKFVLELPAGWLDAHAVELGQRLRVIEPLAVPNLNLPQD